MQGLLESIKGQHPALNANGQLFDYSRSNSAFASNSNTGKRIAIIGSGPAGLSAAHDLALLGHQAVIYEMEPIAAGMMVVGIPEYRLPRDLVALEVEFIKSLGVEIHCNTEVGKDIEFGKILEDFDAVIVAVGAKRSRNLPLPGVDGPSVLGGVEFLREVSLKRPVELGSNIIVIGGGNVAYDVARTAMRKVQIDVAMVAAKQDGAAAVRLVCMESREEMPADDVEVIEGSEEGVILGNRVGADSIVRDSDGKVTGLKCRKVKSVFGPDGRFAPQFYDEYETFSADTVIFAIGQRFELGFLDGVDGLDRDRFGAPVQPKRGFTSHPKIFVAGDLEHGPKLIITAVGSGKLAARSIHKELTGVDISPKMTEVHVPIDNFEREHDYEWQQRHHLPAPPAEERNRSLDMLVEHEPDVAWARHEAGRCFGCSVHTTFNGDKCVLCGGCVDVCPYSCLGFVDAAGREFKLGDETIPNTELRGHTALIKDETICIRCGLCAQRCPTDAISMEKLLVQESA